jgi:type VI secretion system secreted protein VgrG
MARLLTITAPETLTLNRLSVTERVGLPFRIEVDVLGEKPDLVAKDLLTKEICATVQPRLEGDFKRHFHGEVVEFMRLGPGVGRMMAYRLVAAPKIWRLGLRRNCKIFQEKTVKDVVNAVLGDHGISAPKWGIATDFPKMTYCTQFNETDLHFVSRLLEEYGMTYYFEHKEGSHEMHVSGTAQGFPNFAGGDVKAVHESPRFHELGEWRRLNVARTAKVKYQDMDEERSQPSVVLDKTKDTRTYDDEPSMWSAGEVYEWPGDMATRPGLDPAKVSIGEFETRSEAFAARTIDPRFTAGVKLTVGVVDIAGGEKSQQYVVVETRHEAVDNSTLLSGAGGVEDYQGYLTLVSAKRDWVPELRHVRPVMPGIYSAKVTGPSGEKIHVDEHGRIKVKFRWDRFGKDDDSSSCWVRVMQSAAGSWGGTWFLPRVGDEVLVSFLDGDPDRPLVIGSVYGKDWKPPFEPGSNRSQSGFRSRSYKSDSAEDAHILRFEDKKGSEEVYLHSQKDLKVEVEHDETRDVQNKRTTTIVDSDDKLTLKKGNRETTLEMGNETHTLKMGNLTVKLDLGKVLIEALQEIQLKVGQSTVTLDQMGVTVKGMMIKEEAQLMHQTKGLMVQEEATAILMIKGGLTMIN